jgi:heavy metal efflux system protein
MLRIKQIYYSKLKIFLLGLVVLCICGGTNAQSPIELNAAIDSALANNGTLKLEKNKILLAKTQIGSYKNIPKANIGTDIGQINTNLFDTKFGISQSFSMPIVYKRQKELLTNYYATAITQNAIKEFGIKKKITSLFNDYQYLIAKQKLLKEIDSLFTNYENKAILRFEKGENSLLEKTQAINQRQNIELQINSLDEDIKQTLLAFNFILNTKAIFYPVSSDLFKVLDAQGNDLEGNPVLAVLKEHLQIEKSKSALALAQQKPEFLVGFNNTSFSGPALNDKTFTNFNRFTALQLGISLPLFTQYHKNVNQANKIAEKIAQNELDLQKNQLNQAREKLGSNYKARLKTVNFYETTGLNNAKLIKELAEARFSSGEIDFIDLSNYIHQVIILKSDYIESIQAVNKIAIELRYLESQN